MADNAALAVLNDARKRASEALDAALKTKTEYEAQVSAITRQIATHRATIADYDAALADLTPEK